MNILLITNEQKTIETFAEKLILLRDTDEIFYCDYEDAPDIVFADKPDIVIIQEHADKQKTVNLIKYTKTQTDSVLLMINTYDRDFILNAYDAGIDDYFTSYADPSEISIRAVNCIKKDNLKKTVKRYSDYLKQYKILENATNLISPQFAKEIGDFELTCNDFSSGSLSVIAPDEDCKQNYSSDKMIAAIKKSLRYNDIILRSSGAKIFILLPTGGVQAAVAVVNKIQNELKEEFSIKSGITEVAADNMELLEKQAQCALSEAMLSRQTFVIYSENPDTNEENWLEESKEKNFKFFKNAFNKKLEKVITPVFYRLQKSWEEKLFNTKIEQYTDETQSIFRLSNPKQTSLLKIVYPGFAKVIVYITHDGLDSPENSEISLPLNEINTKELTKIIEKFIKEFKNTVE